jgi:tRNA-binding EMAP/Myf-like protein
MQVTQKSAHERTDQLFIYTFESPLQGTKTIVANLTNVYEVGDTAAIAIPGTFLPGLEIVPRKVFGVHSEGMALGKVEAALDADLTAQFEADAPVRPFEVVIRVTVDARYAEDAGKVAEKAIGAGKGVVERANPV